MNAVETLLSFIFGLHLPLVCLLVLVYYILVKPYFRRRLSKRDRRLQSGAATAKPDPNRPRTPELTVPFTLELAQQYHLPSYWSRRTEPIRKVNITPEARFIKLLVYNLWSPKDVGEGKDAVKVGKNKFIKITKVQRVENIALFGLYDENRQMFSRKEEKVQCFKDLSELSTSEVRTTLLIDTVPELARSPLGMEMYHDINEHYLFHGTLPYSVKSICRTGLSTYYASRVMFGKGVYTAESPTKSDQYTDVQGEEARHLEKKLFLCRVCLGELYIANGPAADLNSPPCRECYKKECKQHRYTFDSAVGDVPNFRFREFVVYRDYRIYPEYIITYDRVDTDDEMKKFLLE